MFFVGSLWRDAQVVGRVSVSRCGECLFHAGKAFVVLTATTYLKGSVARCCPRRSQGRCLGIGCGAKQFTRRLHCMWLKISLVINRSGELVAAGVEMYGRSTRSPPLLPTRTNTHKRPALIRIQPGTHRAASKFPLRLMTCPC